MYLYYMNKYLPIYRIRRIVNWPTSFFVHCPTSFVRLLSVPSEYVFLLSRGYGQAVVAWSMQFKYAVWVTEFIIYELHAKTKNDLQYYHISMMLKWMTNKTCTDSAIRQSKGPVPLTDKHNSVCIKDTAENCRKFAKTKWKRVWSGDVKQMNIRSLVDKSG